MEYPWAVPGARVQCIAAPINPEVAGYFRLDLIEVGRILTVRECDTDPLTGRLALRFQEIVNPIHPVFRMEISYFASRFRPLVTRSHEHDVELFKRIADAAPADLEPVQ